MAGVYAADGSMNVTVVDGLTITGIYAADGSINVVLASSGGGGYLGAYHPCGAWWVTLVTSGLQGKRAPDGSLNVEESPFPGTGATRVTAVLGSLSPAGSGFFLQLRNGIDFVLKRDAVSKIEFNH